MKAKHSTENKTHRAARPHVNTRVRKKLDAALAQLQSVELIRADSTNPSEFLFRHALIQDTAEATLLRGEYKRLHRLVAETLERVYADRLDEYAAQLAQHYEHAEDDSKTLEYSVRAGDVAARVYANAEAFTHYARALALAKKQTSNTLLLIELYTKCGRRYELMGKHDRAIVKYQEMEALAQERHDRALELAGMMACMTIYSTPTAKFAPDQARDLSARSLELARALNDRVSEAKILWNRMLLAHFTGQIDEAIANGEQAIALARELNLREQLAYALNDISRPYLIKQNWTKAFAALHQARALWLALDNKPMLADNLNTDATILYAQGNYQDALTELDAAYELGQKIQSAWSQAHSLMTRSLILMEWGEIIQALQAMQEGLRLARQIGFLVATVSIQHTLAITYGELGAWARAFETLSAETMPESSRTLELPMRATRASLYIRQGNLEQAREILENHRAGEYAMVSTYFVNNIRTLQTELALAEHDYAGALAWAEQLLQPGQDILSRPTILNAMYFRVCALAGLERTDEALTLAQQLCAFAEPLPSRRMLWKTYALMGDLEQTRGNPTAAEKYRAQARAVIEFIAAHAPNDLRDSFLDLPRVRAVLETARTL